jgi:hypothetical protein
MDILAFLILVLLLLAMDRLVLAALAIQKNTREVADHSLQHRSPVFCLAVSPR